jgi:SAM-dependent methyltransferase
VTDFDVIEPETYLARFERSPRERYLRDHWRPLTQAAIERYCRGRRILDLGCGFGDYTQLVTWAELRIGVDLAYTWLKYARESNGIESVVQADAQHVPLAARSCDAVLSIGLLEYVDPDVVLREIARVLQPGGYCVLVGANKYSGYRRVLRLLLALRGRPYTVREVSVSRLEHSMRRNGIQPVEVHMDDGLIWVPDWVDRRLGTHLYRQLEELARRVPRNPLSNVMLVIGQRQP